MSEERCQITKQLLKSRSGEFDIESIHSLVLTSQNLSELGCIGECIGLERLDLSQNIISRLYSLAGLTSLTHLNLSANRISSLEGLQALDNLEFLNLSGNLIGSMDCLHSIAGLEKLKDLRLQNKVKELSNPVCMNSSYKRDALAIMTKLISLDVSCFELGEGERITGKGNELYKTCEEIDEMLRKQENSCQHGDIIPAKPWMSPDRWQPSRRFENESSLADAETQLKDLLADCRRVQQQAADDIRHSEQDLQLVLNT